VKLPRRPLVGDAGDDILAHKRVLTRNLDRLEGGQRLAKFFDQVPRVRRRWLKGNEVMAETARKHLLPLSPGRGLDQQLFDRMIAAGWYRDFELSLIDKYNKLTPIIGPVYLGGISLLDYDLTHATSGIPLFPAFDTAFSSGVSIIAPEDVVVDTRHTSSNPGHAVYLTGKSGLRYWVGHLDRDWPLGTIRRRGELLGSTPRSSSAPARSLSTTRTTRTARPRSESSFSGSSARPYPLRHRREPR
jgi:hypothetical protein